MLHTIYSGLNFVVSDLIADQLTKTTGPLLTYNPFKADQIELDYILYVVYKYKTNNMILIIS
jgi:hypothetical protein